MKMIETSGKITANFKGSEFRCKCGCGKILIAEELVQQLQRVRDHFGKSVTVNSGYRCAKHNKNVGSTSGSPHLLGLAADIKIKGVSSEDIAIIAEQIGFDGIALINDAAIHLDLKGRKWYADERTNQTFATFQPKSTTLKLGSTGDDVRRLQQALSDKGCYFADHIDGTFGKETEGAVMVFQKDSNLEVDGIAGPATRKAIGI